MMALEARAGVPVAAKLEVLSDPVRIRQAARRLWGLPAGYATRSTIVVLWVKGTASALAHLRYAALVVVPRDFCHITCTMPPATGYILPIGGISMRCSSSTLFFVQSQQVYA